MKLTDTHKKKEHISTAIKVVGSKPFFSEAKTKQAASSIITDNHSQPLLSSSASLKKSKQSEQLITPFFRSSQGIYSKSTNTSKEKKETDINAVTTISNIPGIILKNNSELTVQQRILQVTDSVTKSSATEQHQPPQPGTSLVRTTSATTKNGAQANNLTAGKSIKMIPGSAYKHLQAISTEKLLLSRLHKAENLANTNTATKSAAEKIQESEQAQDIPVSENQAISNAGRIKILDDKKISPKTESLSKKMLEEGIKKSVPANMDEMDKFKDSGKAEEIGQMLITQVNTDVADVKEGFDGIEEVHTTGVSKKGTALPAPEEAVHVAKINMGEGVIPSVPAEELDTKEYRNQSNDLLKQAGISQEHLDIANSGDLAAANKERKQLEKESSTQPLAIQQLVSAEHKKLEAVMQAEETAARNTMQEQRSRHLSHTGAKQIKAKLDLEKKRDEVSRVINLRYEGCQKNIKNRLNDLEKNSLAQFSNGQAKATRDFGIQVHSDISKFKEKRYSQTGGSLLWVKDSFLGIDDFPEVVYAFDNARRKFVSDVNLLISDITKANNEVITGCKKELDDTKAGIAVYISSLEPALKDVGKKVAEEINNKLLELGTEINKCKENLQQKLVDKRKAAMEAIDKRIDVMKTALSGALSIIGNLLLDAAMKFFKWSLESVGLSVTDIMGVINKGAAVIRSIVTKPIDFVRNLTSAARTGFTNFGKNFLEHLKNAVFTWLTGSLEGVNLPKVWDVKGIFSLVLDILGITYKVMRGKMVKLMGETVVANLEKTVSLVKTLVTDGPIAAWEQLKEMAGEIKNTFIDAIKNWIQTTIIYKAIESIVSMFIPGAGLVKAIIGIYDTVMFFVQKAKDIFAMVGNFLGSVAEITAGKIDAGANALEKGLAGALTMVINFLARFLHLNGITDKIKKVIEAIRAKVSIVMDKVIVWIQQMVSKLIAKGKSAVRAVLGWIGLKKNFTAADKKTHSINMEGEEKNPQIIIRSEPVTLETLISDFRKSAEYKKDQDGYEIKIQKSLQIKNRFSNALEKNQGKGEEDHDKQFETMAQSLIDCIRGFFIGPSASDVNKVTFKELHNGSASGMESNPLINDKTEGQKTTKATGIYEPLFKRKHHEGNTPYYIQGHLLNHTLGGPNDYKNLTPLKRSTNAEHEAIIERSLKKYYKENKKLKYIVEPVYGPGSAPNIDEVSVVLNNPKSTKEQKIAKLKPLEASSVPVSLSIQSSYYIKEGDKEVEKPIFNGTINNNIETNDADYVFEKI